jgi:pimeloyl-ACP methyl ester carboxylesterase
MFVGESRRASTGRALDQRGHGDSEISKPRDSLSLLVSDALALLDLVDAMNAHIVGNSAGVTQQLAIRHPERVTTLDLSGRFPASSIVGPIDVR